jgi:N-acetylmuramoyl-L-alanine amidase
VSVAVDVGPRFGSYRASTQTLGAGTRLVLDLLPPVETSAAAPGPAPAPAAPPELPPFGPPASTIRTITIDPGHGGDDIGARGENGTLEKELTLAVARRLKSTFETRVGIRVLLTRDDDRTLPGDRRTAVANNNKADVFISLHANGSVQKAAQGASIYVAAFDDAGAPDALASTRVPVFGGGLRDIELVPWDFAQTRHLDQSLELAARLVDALRDKVPLGVRPIDRAPFRVLESANMPAILVEMGYLTNPEHERALAGARFQTTFVQAVFDAVLGFRAYLSEGGVGQ